MSTVSRVELGSNGNGRVPREQCPMRNVLFILVTLSGCRWPEPENNGREKISMAPMPGRHAQIERFTASETRARETEGHKALSNSALQNNSKCDCQKTSADHSRASHTSKGALFD